MKLKITAVILLAVMCVGLLAGCKNAGDKTQLPIAEKVTNVYKTDTVSIPNNINLSSNYIVMNDRVYAVGMEVIDEETYELQNYLCSFDLNGENLEMKPIDIGGISYISYFSITPDNSLILLTDQFDPETEQSITMISKYNSDNELVFAIDPATMFAPPEVDDTPGFMSMIGVYIRNFATDGNGNIYIPNNNVILAMSPDGEKLFEINTDASYISTINQTHEGKVYVVYNDNANYGEVMRYIDFDGKSLGETVEVPSMNDGYGGRGMSFSVGGGSNVYIGEGYDLYLKENSGFYGYNHAGEEKTLLCDWINSDINAIMINDVTVISPDKLVYSAFDELAGNIRINILTHIPDDEVKAKYLISLATFYNDNTLTTAIINFNRANEEYRIVTRDYSQYNEDAEKQLDLDILNGNLTDIVLLPTSMQADKYINKNMFVNLYDYFDNDPDVSRDVLLNCVKAPFERDGKLYQLFTSFTMNTLVGKTEFVGDTTTWTVDEVLEFIKNMPADKSFTDYDNRDSLTGILLTKGLDSYIDYTNGTCNFDSQGFIDILNYLISLDKSDIDSYMNSREYRTDRYRKLREDEAYITTAYINSFTQFLQLKFQFGFENISFKGYPTATGDGTMITGDSYVISAKSQLKDGAWQFLKYLISDELQTSQNFIMNWPATVNGLKFAGEQEMKREYTFNFSGGYTASFSSGNMMISTVMSDGEMDGTNAGEDATLTQEDVDYMLEFLNSDFSGVNYTTDLFNIISEELAIFFNGQKTAEETAKVIQSRASIYISENN
jgi:ABC-type sugar transport system, periplasmic component